MSTDNVENLVSVDEINTAIETFIGKHPENVSVWIDGKTATIQISNIGLRDPLFYRLSYLVENTTIEDKLTVFKMPAKCVIANERIARFVCTLNELVTFVEKANDSSIEPETPLSPHIKKFSNRLSTSHAFKRAEIIVNQVVNDDDSSKITVYIISEPSRHDNDEHGNRSPHVTWKVIGIMKIDAGTTWEDEEFRNRLYELKASQGLISNSGEYGAFNVYFDSFHSNKIYDEHGKLIGFNPEFVLDPSIKIGDTIDSRDYKDSDLWSNGGYQTNENDYQKYSNFAGTQLYSSPDIIFGKTLIPDGAVITI